MLFSPVRTSPPAATPISLDEAKAHLRVDHSDDDELITAFIEAATDHLDGYSGILGRCLVTQTWRIDMDAFWTDSFRLPLAPVQSITTIEYWGGSSYTAVAAENYSLHADALGPLIVTVSGYSWPSYTARTDAVRVTAVYGYGAPADVPAPIKAAILLMVGSLYENRGDDGGGMSPTVHALLAPYRRWSV